MVRDIIQEDDPIIREKMPDIKDAKKIAQVIKDLTETMLDSGAAGFAANQINERVNICIVGQYDYKTFKYSKDVIALVNPKIVFRSGSQASSEGCFSIPGYVAVIPRPTLIKVACKDKLYTLTGVEAWIACHEIDHLNGILIRDYVEGTHGKSGGRLISDKRMNQPAIYKKQKERVRKP